MTEEPHLLMHDRVDNVGVVVVEDLKAGTEMLCRITEDNSTFRMVVHDDVPIGHKVAIVDLKKEDTVIKYGEDIGRMIGDAPKGKHVHVHNMKTKRW